MQSTGGPALSRYLGAITASCLASILPARARRSSAEATSATVPWSPSSRCTAGAVRQVSSRWLMIRLSSGRMLPSSLLPASRARLRRAPACRQSAARAFLPLVPWLPEAKERASTSRRRQLNLLAPLLFSVVDLDLKPGDAVLQVFRHFKSAVLRLELGFHLAIHHENVATRRRFGCGSHGRWRQCWRGHSALLAHWVTPIWGN